MRTGADILAATLGAFRSDHPQADLSIALRLADGTVQATDDAAFPLYSLTKTLIATLVLQQVARGRLRLDDPAGDHLDPPFDSIDKGATIGRLLAHRGGLPDYGPMPEYHAAVRAEPGRPWTEREFFERTMAAGAPVPEGAFRYSNIGYMLLRRIAARAAGRQWPELVRTELAAPLGLGSLRALEGLADMAPLAPGRSAYLAPDGPPVDVRSRYHPGWVAHGLCAASAADAVAFLTALFDGDLLPPALRGEMTRPEKVAVEAPPFVEPAYGLGLMIDTAGRHGVLRGHNGGGPGHQIAAYRAARIGITGVVAVHDDSGPAPLPLLLDLFDALAPK